MNHLRIYSFRNDSSAHIVRILMVWLFFISFWYSYVNIADWVPVLWKPIPPFQHLTLTNPMMDGFLWVWRIVLIISFVFPKNLLSLGAACAFTFFCLGIRSCFGLQPQMFAPLELALILIFIYILLIRGKDQVQEIGFLIKLVTVLLFFSAGVSKLRWSGLGWPFSDSLEQNFKMLYPLNSSVLGFPWILELRQWILENRQFFQWGSVGILLFELISPLALISKTWSRFILIGSVSFVLANLILFGITFYTILPMLLIWGLWDISFHDLLKSFKEKRQAFRVLMGLAVIFVFLQLGVSLFANQNFWPLMQNDMYARPAAFPPIREMAFTLIRADGSREIISNSTMHSPFSKFHLSIALFRKKDRADRDRLLHTIFKNYKDRMCSRNCEDFLAFEVTWSLDGSPSEVLASTR